jgi:4-amino-4-deoxy-L-arabinose transferase-like glycosyltransferase
VLPLSEWTARLPSVVVAMTDVVLMYFVARRMFTRHRPAVLAAVLLALTPAHFIHGRIAMDYLYPVPFVIGWLLCLLIFLDRRRPRVLFAATSLLGLGIYTYIASVVMMPVYLALTGLALFRTGHPRRSYAIAAAGFAWPLVLLLWLAFHPAILGETLVRYHLDRPVAETTRVIRRLPMPELLDEVRRSVRFSEATGRISLYWYFFDPAYLFVTGGYANIVNSTRHAGVFLLPFVVLVPVGIVAAASSRTIVGVTILIGFLSAPLAACLVVPEPYAVDRELVILPFGVLLAVIGVEAMLASRTPRWRAAAVVLLAIVPLQFAFFLFDYYGDYRRFSAVWFNGNRRGALEEIIARDVRKPAPAVYLSVAHVPYLEAYWRLYLTKHHRTDLLARSVYFDEGSLDVQTVPRGALLLATRKDAHVTALVAQQQLRKLVDIVEPAEPSYFSVLER